MNPGTVRMRVGACGRGRLQGRRARATPEPGGGMPRWGWSIRQVWGGKDDKSRSTRLAFPPGSRPRPRRSACRRLDDVWRRSHLCIDVNHTCAFRRWDEGAATERSASVRGIMAGSCIEISAASAEISSHVRPVRCGIGGNGSASLATAPGVACGDANAPPGLQQAPRSPQPCRHCDPSVDNARGTHRASRGRSAGRSGDGAPRRVQAWGMEHDAAAPTLGSDVLSHSADEVEGSE